MINSEQVQILAQLIEAMNEAASKMEVAAKKGKREEYEKAEAEVLNFQKQISKLLGEEK